MMMMIVIMIMTSTDIDRHSILILPSPHGAASRIQYDVHEEMKDPHKYSHISQREEHKFHCTNTQYKGTVYKSDTKYCQSDYIANIQNHDVLT